MLGVYRRLAALRRARPELTDPAFTQVACLVDEGARTFEMWRGDVHVVVNFGDEPAVLCAEFAEAMDDDLGVPQALAARATATTPDNAAMRRLELRAIARLAFTGRAETGCGLGDEGTGTNVKAFTHERNDCAKVRSNNSVTPGGFARPDLSERASRGPR